MLAASVGYPSCGASTWAAGFKGRLGLVVADRRDLRRALTGSARPGDESQEALVDKLYWSTVSTALADGLTVVSAERNLLARHRNHLEALAKRHGAPMCWVSFLHLPGPELVRRDQSRAEPVGSDAIFRARYDFRPEKLANHLRASGLPVLTPEAGMAAVLGLRDAA